MNYYEFMYPGECLLMQVPRNKPNTPDEQYTVSLRKDGSGSEYATSNGIELSCPIGSPSDARVLRLHSGDTLYVLYEINCLCYANVAVEKVAVDEDGIKLCAWFDALCQNEVGNLTSEPGCSLVDGYREKRESMLRSQVGTADATSE